MKPTSPLWILLVRWSGRITALILGAFLMLFIVGEGFIGGHGPPPLHVLAPFLVVLAGLGLGWRYEALGGLLLLVAFGYFNLMEWRANGRFLRLGAFHLMLAPAVLYLTAWFGQTLASRSREPRGG